MTTPTPSPESSPTAVGVTMPTTFGRTSVVEGHGMVVMVCAPPALSWSLSQSCKKVTRAMSRAERNRYPGTRGRAVSSGCWRRWARSDRAEDRCRDHWARRRRPLGCSRCRSARYRPRGSRAACCRQLLLAGCTASRPSWGPRGQQPEAVRGETDHGDEYDERHTAGEEHPSMRGAKFARPHSQCAQDDVERSTRPERSIHY